MIELKNGNFYDVNTGRFYPRETRFFINGNKFLITQKKQTKSVCETIDLQGKYILPGLINTHCHIQSIVPTVLLNIKTVYAVKKYFKRQIDKNMTDCLKRGITNIRDAWSVSTFGNAELKKRIERKELLGPRIMQSIVIGISGGYLTPGYSTIKRQLSRIAIQDMNKRKKYPGVLTLPENASEQKIRDIINDAIDLYSADTIKVGESLEKSIINPHPRIMSQKVLAAITSQASKRGVPSTIHCVSVSTFRRAIDAGFTSLAHIPRNGDLTSHDINDFIKSNIILEPTLSVGYEFSWKNGEPLSSCSAEFELFNDYREKYFVKNIEEFWIPALQNFAVKGYNKVKKGHFSSFGFVRMSKFFSHYSSIIKYGARNLRNLIENGAVITCGNDAGGQSSTPAMIGNELRILHLLAGGKLFTPERRIETATINSAKALGIDDRFGSIETGKVGDFVIYDKNPLENPDIIGEEAAAVFVNGELAINNCNLLTTYLPKE